MLSIMNAEIYKKRCIFICATVHSLLLKRNIFQVIMQSKNHVKKEEGNAKERERKKAHNTKNCNYNFLPSSLSPSSSSLVVTSLCLFATGIYCARSKRRDREEHEDKKALKERKECQCVCRSIYEVFT